MPNLETQPSITRTVNDTTLSFLVSLTRAGYDVSLSRLQLNALLEKYCPGGNRQKALEFAPSLGKINQQIRSVLHASCQIKSNQKKAWVTEWHLCDKYTNIATLDVASSDVGLNGVNEVFNKLAHPYTERSDCCKIIGGFLNEERCISVYYYYNWFLFAL